MYPVLCPFCEGKMQHCPVCKGSGLVLASQVTGMAGLDGFSLGFISKITKNVTKEFKDVGKVIKQIPRYPTKLAKQTGTQISEHRKELVGAAGVIVGATLLPLSMPAALAVAGAGLGMATKPGAGLGKPKTWLVRGAAGGAIGTTAGIGVNLIAGAPSIWGTPSMFASPLL
jgi:hypothetical protein